MGKGRKGSILSPADKCNIDNTADESRRFRNIHDFLPFLFLSFIPLHPSDRSSINKKIISRQRRCKNFFPLPLFLFFPLSFRFVFFLSLSIRSHPFPLLFRSTLIDKNHVALYREGFCIYRWVNCFQ